MVTYGTVAGANEEGDRHSRGSVGRRGVLRTLGAAAVGAVLPVTGTATAQEQPGSPSVQWKRTYGGGGRDVAYDIIEVADGYVFAGYDGSEPCTGGWLVKLCSDGNVRWKRTFPDLGAISSLVRASDGGYVLAVDETLVKVDSTGERQWQTEVGFGIVSLLKLTDGGYAFTGWSEGSGFETYAAVAKVTATGNLAWRRVLTEPEDGQPSEDILTEAWDRFYSVIQSTDGTIVVGGVDGFINESVEFIGAPWIVRLSPTGELLSESSDEITFYAEINGLVPTPDGGYASAGWDFSRGTFLRETGGFSAVYEDEGLGINFRDSISLVRTSEGGYAIGGYGDEHDPLDYDGGLVVTVDSSGELLWRRRYGADNRTAGTALIQTTDGGYALAGAQEVDGELDAWVVKLD